MARRAACRSETNRTCRVRPYRPHLEALEGRLLPGDALGWLLSVPAQVAGDSWPAALEIAQPESGILPFDSVFSGPFTFLDRLDISGSKLSAADLSLADQPLPPALSASLTVDWVGLPRTGADDLRGSAEWSPPVDQGTGTEIDGPRNAVGSVPALLPATPAPLAAVAPRGASPVRMNQAQAREQFGHLPLRFEANQGQADASVRYLAHGPGYSLFLTSTEAVMVLNPGHALGLSENGPTAGNRSAAVVRMQVLGGSAAAVVGGNELPGQVNYVLGQDPDRWQFGIPTYAQVEYQGVYPGIDLVYYGNAGQLEYDFVVGPGADPRRIALGFPGAESMAVDGQGDLVLEAGGVSWRQHQPLLYQEVHGIRQTIAGAFVQEGQQIGFRVGTYDPSQPLVIDPILSYSTYLGGSGDDYGRSVAVDAAGNAYVTGYTSSTDFPTQDAFQSFQGGGYNAFVASLDPAGQLRYATYLGGSNVDYGYGIAVDPAGNAYVTGWTSSTDFPTQNAFQPDYGGGTWDGFVASLDRAGRLRYSTYLGGSNDDRGYGIAVDPAGNAYVTGSTTSADFPTLNAFQPVLGGGAYGDAFVTSLDRAGRLRYSTYLGGSGDDRGQGIAVDPAGNAYVTGGTDSTDFPICHALQPVLGGDHNAFVTSLDRAGRLRYSTYLGGSGSDSGEGIAADGAGNAYVTGYTGSPDFPTQNAFQPAYGGGLLDGFVTGLDHAGHLVYSTYLGGSGNDVGEGIAVDSAGHAYVTGYTGSSNFPILNAIQSAYGGGPFDAFVTNLDRGGQPIYSTYLGGSGADYGRGIAVDAAGNAYVTGSTVSTDFPTQNAVQPIYGGGGSDSFVAKIASDSRNP